MFLTTNDIIEIDEQGEERLIDFLKQKIPEGPYLDYKRSVVEEGEDNLAPKSKWNFLKDVSGFANANGGDIIYGALEPADTLDVKEQLVGIKNAQAIAKTFESLLAGNVEPRIYGVRVIVVALSNGRHAIIIHIPPSQGRPHMATQEKMRTFFIRHSESTVPMTSYEIKQSVLLAASEEGMARDYLRQHQSEVASFLDQQGPYFHLQAMPLHQSEQPLDVLTNEIKNVLKGKSRAGKYRYDGLESSYSPWPTIDGIQVMDVPDKPEWSTEIHRNGYISCWYKNRKSDENGIDYLIWYHNIERLYLAFCDLCNEALSELRFDSVYIMRCSLHEALRVYFGCAPENEYATRDIRCPIKKQALAWPEQIRSLGASFEPIARQWYVQLHHAYGVERVK